MQVNRSFLFTPGNHPRKVEKVFEAGADAVILDLEDAVAIGEKEATRSVVVAALLAPRPCRGYVRINGLETPFTYGDLDVVVAPGVDGIIVPKIESAADFQKIDWLVGEMEKARGLPVGGIDLMPILETGKGIANAREICAAGGRLKRVSFGGGDYTRDMGMVWTRSEHECQQARAEIVLASRITGLEPPIDTVWIHLQDTDGLTASTRTIQEMGFQGKLCIHPSQLAPVHAVLTPDADAMAWAERIITAFETAEAEGSASIQIDGYFVDYPIVENARRTLALGKAAQ